MYWGLFKKDTGLLRNIEGMCNICDCAARRFMSAKLHVCSKNHLLGSFKSMESDAGVEMVMKAVDYLSSLLHYNGL